MEFIDIDAGDQEREEILEKYRKLISEPYDHLESFAGKKVNERIAYLCNYWFNLTTQDIDTINSISFKVQNIILLLDDIQDNSYKRRGAPTAHTVYGRARTISSVNHVLYITLYENIPSHLEIPIRHWVSILFFRCLKGQIMDTYWRDNFICPSEEAYLDMVCKKTGFAFELVFNLAMEFSGKKDKNYKTLCYASAMHFQIVDDYCNLKSDKYFKTKGFCEDISEGKFSYPIICALRNHPEDLRIVEILRMKTTDNTIKRECLELIEMYGGFQDTKNKLSTLRAEVSNQIDRLGGHSKKDAWMEFLDCQMK